MSNEVRGEETLPPVSHLMCQDLKMGTILVEQGPLNRKEVRFFISLLEDVVKRWYSAIGRMNKAVYSTYAENTGLLYNLEDTFEKVLECDTEDIFNRRVELYNAIQDFISMVDGFAEVFSGPKELKHFYFNINSRLVATTEIMLEGKYGW